MKVRQLIKMLQKFDPEAEVFNSDCEWGLGMCSKPTKATKDQIEELKDIASRPGLFRDEPDIKLSSKDLKHGAVII